MAEGDVKPNGQLSEQQRTLIDRMPKFPNERIRTEGYGQPGGSAEQLRRAEQLDQHQELLNLVALFEEQEATTSPQLMLEAVTTQYDPTRGENESSLAEIKDHVDGCENCRAAVAESTSKAARYFFLRTPLDE